MDYALKPLGQSAPAEVFETLLAHHRGVLSDSTVASALYQADMGGQRDFAQRLLRLASPRVAWYQAVRTNDLALARTVLPRVNDLQDEFSGLCDSMTLDSVEFLKLYREQRNHLPPDMAKCAKGPATLEYLLEQGWDPNRVEQGTESKLAGLMLGMPTGQVRSSSTVIVPVPRRLEESFSTLVKSIFTSRWAGVMKFVEAPPGIRLVPGSMCRCR